MGPHAGYAATVAIAESTMQALLRTLYVTNKIKHLLRVDTRFPVDGEPAHLTGSLFFDVPRLTLAKANDQRYALDLRAWGPIQLTLASGLQVSRTVLLTAGILVAPKVWFDDSGLRFGIDGSSATLQAFNVEVIAGGPLPVDLGTVTSGEDFRKGFETVLRQQFSEQAAAPLDLAFLGKVALAPQKTAAIRVLDGAVVIGIDVGWFDPLIDGMLAMYVTPPVDTTGNPDELVDFRGHHGAAFCLNPSQLGIAFVDALLTARDQAAEQDATLDTFEITAGDGALQVAGRASKTGGSLTFRFDARPHLSNERIFTWREVLYFETTNVRVDLGFDWWVSVLEAFASVFTAGVASIGVIGLTDALRAGTRHALTGLRSQTVPRNNQFTLPDTTKPLIDLRIETYRVRPDGLIATLSLKPRLPKPRLSGASQLFVDPDGVPHARLFYAVTLPVDVLRTDPQLRVRWTLRRMDTSGQVDTSDGDALSTRTYKRDVPFPGDGSVPPLRMECRVYRTIGARTEEVYQGRAAVGDRQGHPLDASHPFVRWRDATLVPELRREADGTLTRIGFSQVTRFSRIHRTDLPGRCLFADAGVLSLPEYLDELPFPRVELLRLRAQVCDYCFFGGPTGNEPLI